MLNYLFTMFTRVFAITLALGSTMTAQAQVYETTDAQGNTVFTDVPPTEDAKIVDVDTTNIADSVEVRPPEPKAPPAETPSRNIAPPTEVTTIDEDDDLRDDLYENRRREEVRDRLPNTDRPVVKPRPHPIRR